MAAALLASLLLACFAAFLLILRLDVEGAPVDERSAAMFAELSPAREPGFPPEPARRVPLAPWLSS